MNIDVGQVIAGKYELVRLLGKGAMGEVWLATHNSLGGEFAIKLVEPTDDIEAETAAGRFQLEAQIAAKLSRKTRHIVSVSDHGEENGLAYLVMELLEGESLEQRTKNSGALDLPEVAAIVTQVARALSLAHEEGIFHRDLKPANVWLGKDEDGRMLVKLLDFGIARSQKPFRTRSPFATSKDMVLGTPSYMSPEQARGLDSLDYRCDLWALSVVAYEALTRKIPFEGETVEDIFLSICTFRVVPALTRRPDLPPIIEAFFARAFASKLEDRFSTAAELTAAFEQMVDPEALEKALGLPLTPASQRRLEARSNPSLPNINNIPTPGPGGFGVVSGGNDAFASSSNPQRFGSSPDLEGPAGVDPMSIGLAGPGQRRGGVGWLIAIAGVIAILGVGVLALVTFRSPKPAYTRPADPIQTQQPPTASSLPPPPTVASGNIPPPPPPSTPTTAATEEPSGPKPKPIPIRPPAPGKPATAAQPHPQPPAPVASPTPPPPAPAPQPTTVKTVNKGEVF